MRRATKKMTNPWDQAQFRFYAGANSDKKSESGLNFFWSDGVNPNAGLLGELSLPISVPKFRSLMIINSDPLIQYIAFTDGHVLPKVIAPAPLVHVQTDPLATSPSATGYFQMASIAGLNIGDHMYFWDRFQPAPASGYLVSMDPTNDKDINNDGTTLGFISVDDASDFSIDEWINVENDPIPIGPAIGYIGNIADGIWATGTLTAVAGAALANGQTFTLNDGITSYTFEFRSAGFPAPGNIPINFLVWHPAANIAGRIYTAITSFSPFVCFGTGGLTLGLMNSATGIAGNVAITEVLGGGASLSPSGMSGGVNAGGGKFGIRIVDLPGGGGSAVDLSGYTIALGAHIYHAPVGFRVHMQDAPIGGADVDLSAYSSFIIGSDLYTYGPAGAINNFSTNQETITTTTPHGYKIGDNISIAGVADPWFDWASNVIISVPSPTSFIVAGGGDNRISGAGTTDLGIPYDALSGIPIPPNGGKLIVAIGDNNVLVQASSANVFGYLSKNSIIQLTDNL